jgi:hypothetical protein
MFARNSGRERASIPVNFFYTKGTSYCFVPVDVIQTSPSTSSLFLKLSLFLESQLANGDSTSYFQDSFPFICIESRNRNSSIHSTHIDLYYNDSSLNVIKTFLNAKENVLAYIDVITNVYDAMEVELLPNSVLDWENASRKASLIENLFMKQYNNLYLHQKICIHLTPSLKVYFSVTNIKILNDITLQNLNINASVNTKNITNNTVPPYITRLSTETVLLITPVTASSFANTSHHIVPSPPLSNTTIPLTNNADTTSTPLIKTTNNNDQFLICNLRVLPERFRNVITNYSFFASAQTLTQTGATLHPNTQTHQHRNAGITTDSRTGQSFDRCNQHEDLLTSLLTAYEQDATNTTTSSSNNNNNNNNNSSRSGNNNIRSSGFKRSSNSSSSGTSTSRSSSSNSVDVNLCVVHPSVISDTARLHAFTVLSHAQPLRRSSLNKKQSASKGNNNNNNNNNSNNNNNNNSSSSSSSSSSSNNNNNNTNNNNSS